MYFLLSRSFSLIFTSCDAGPCLFFVNLVRSFPGPWTWKNVVSFSKAIDHHLGCRSARCTLQSNAVVLAVNECSM